jgi:hypothetical protein
VRPLGVDATDEVEAAIDVGVLKGIEREKEEEEEEEEDEHNSGEGTETTGAESGKEPLPRSIDIRSGLRT